MEVVIAVMALLFMLFVALGVYATVKVVGVARRGVDRTLGQARRTVEDTTLRARSLARPGPAGEVAELRLKLRGSMRATQDALHAQAQADPSVRESLSLFERLSAHGHELDAELRRLESDPDRAVLAERLPQLRSRTEQITSRADALRWAVHERAQRFAGDDLESLGAQIDVETGALRHWADGEAEGRGADPESGRSVWPESGAVPGSTRSGPRSEPRSEPGARGPAASGDQAAAELPPGAEGRDVSYPWRKEPRPESTT